MKRMKHLAFAIGIIVLMANCSRPGQSVSSEPRVVKAITPVASKSNFQLEFNGTLVESRKADIAFRVGGPISAIFAEEGDFVKTGDLLASIDPRDYQIRLIAAEAQFNQAKAEYERYSELHNQNKLPANTYEKLKTAYLAAKSNWENAINAHIDTRLYAPFSGYIFKRNINRHETIVPGISAFTIIDLSDLEVVFGIPETMVPKMGKPVIASVEAGGMEIQANLKSVAGKSGDNNLYEVRLSLNNPDVTKIKPGMSARIIMTINTDVNSQSFLIPIEAVFYKQQTPYVWIFNEASGSVSARQIKTGSLNGNGQIDVVTGLSGSEKIIAAGVNSLLEDQKVRLSAQNISL